MKSENNVCIKMRPTDNGDGYWAEVHPPPNVTAERIDTIGNDDSNAEETMDPDGGECFEDLKEKICQQISDMREQVTQLVARDTLLAHLHEQLSKASEQQRIQSFHEPLTRKIAPIHRRIAEQRILLKRELDKLLPHSRRRPVYLWSYKALESIHIELEQILSDFGIEAYSNLEARFDRSVQEAIERIPTEDTQRVGVIARRLSRGYRIGERVLISERVAVYVKQTNTSRKEKVS